MYVLMNTGLPLQANELRANGTIRQKVSILVPQNLLATQTVNNVDRF